MRRKVNLAQQSDYDIIHPSSLAFFTMTSAPTPRLVRPSRAVVCISRGTGLGQSSTVSTRARRQPQRESE